MYTHFTLAPTMAVWVTGRKRDVGFPPSLPHSDGSGYASHPIRVRVRVRACAAQLGLAMRAIHGVDVVYVVAATAVAACRRLASYRVRL